MLERKIQGFFLAASRTSFSLLAFKTQIVQSLLIKRLKSHAHIRFIGNGYDRRINDVFYHSSPKLLKYDCPCVLALLMH
jgi:hypothetical protein